MAEKKLNGIGGWLILITLMFIFSAIANTYLLIQKIILLFNNPSLGIYISAILSGIYCVLIWLSIIFIFMKKKIAIKLFIYVIVAGTIFIFWYFLISQLIYSSLNFMEILQNNLIIILFNLIINILVVIYLLKSKRVKTTLTK